MNTCSVFKVFVGSCVLSWLCGCTHARLDPASKVKSELAERKARGARSMELCRKGVDARERHNVSRARQLLNEAVREDNRNSHAWMEIGLLEFSQENLYEAACAFHRAARLEPTRYEPHFNIGIILESANRYSGAIDKYEVALKLAPNQVEVMENLARCYIKTNTKLDKARELVDRALKSEYRPEWVRWLQRQSLHLQRQREGNDEH